MNRVKIKWFFILTFTWTWVFWLPFVLPYFNVYEMSTTLEGLLLPVTIVGAFGPMFAAVVLTLKYEGKSGLKAYFKRCFDFKTGIKFYIFAILLSGGITVCVHYIVILLGISDLPTTLMPDDIGMPLWVVAILYFFVMLFFGGGQEEFGWRGYVQEKLQDEVGVLKGSLFLGFVWGLWHAPLWIIPGEGHANYSFIAFVLFTTSWALSIGILYNKSGKKLVIPWLMHAVSNLAVPLFPILFMEDVAQPAYWIFVGCNIIVAAILWIIYKNEMKGIPVEE
jgi:membrane protease YdiL (CAAX protease family)